MKLRANNFDLDSLPKSETAVQTEKIIGAIKDAIIKKKEEWLAYHIRKLLGDEIASRAFLEPTVVRSIMKERGIWLKDEGNTMTLMVNETPYSKFILEFKKP